MILTFTVFGTAKPKGSLNAFQHQTTGKLLVRPASAGLRAWEAAVREEAQKFAAQQVFILGPVKVEIDFVFSRPKSVSVAKRPHMTVPPDLDKLTRSCLDPLTGVLLNDDAQVTEICVRKVYGTRDKPSHAQFTITELDAAIGSRMEFDQEDVAHAPLEAR